MEEDDVSLLHVQVDSWSLDDIVVLDTEVGLVDLSLPLGVDMPQKLTLVGARVEVQGTVLLGRILKRGPSSDDSVGWPEREIGQILMEWVSRARSHIGGLVDKHRVDGLDVLAAEALEVGDEIGIVAVGVKLLVELEILEFSDSGLPCDIFATFHEGDIPDDLHTGHWGDLLVAVVDETLFPLLDVSVLQELPDNQIAVFLIKVPLGLG
jgi:hypothetical protein